jgi:hypothetical protein
MFDLIKEAFYNLKRKLIVTNPFKIIQTNPLNLTNAIS